MMKKRELLVKSLETDEVVHRIDVTDKSDRQVEKVEMGLLHKVDLERFYVDDTGEVGE